MEKAYKNASKEVLRCIAALHSFQLNATCLCLSYTQQDWYSDLIRGFNKNVLL